MLARIIHRGLTPWAAVSLMALAACGPPAPPEGSDQVVALLEDNQRRCGELADDLVGAWWRATDRRERAASSYPERPPWQLRKERLRALALGAIVRSRLDAMPSDNPAVRDLGRMLEENEQLCRLLTDPTKTMGEIWGETAALRLSYGRLRGTLPESLRLADYQVTALLLEIEPQLAEVSQLETRIEEREAEEERARLAEVRAAESNQERLWEARKRAMEADRQRRLRLEQQWRDRQLAAIDRAEEQEEREDEARTARSEQLLARQEAARRAAAAASGPSPWLRDFEVAYAGVDEVLAAYQTARRENRTAAVTAACDSVAERAEKSLGSLPAPKDALAQRHLGTLLERLRRFSRVCRSGQFKQADTYVLRSREAAESLRARLGGR